MIKIPGTAEGLPAIQQAISEGININVTLALRAGCLREGGGSLHRRPGAIRQERWRRQPDGQRGQLLHQPHRLRGRCHHRHQAQSFQRCARAGAAEEHPGQSRDRQRQADLREVSGHLQHASLESSGRQGRADPARALGQHQHQESGLPRCAVRRRTDRAGHGGHHSARHLRRLPRSRQAAPEPDRRSCGGPQDDGNRGQSLVSP